MDALLDFNGKTAIVTGGRRGLGKAMATALAERGALVTGNTVRALREMFEAILRGGAVWPQVNPAPFFSACLAGCLESRRDYSEGGARYNPHGVPLADSLSAIRFLCFEQKLCTLAELLSAVRADWNGYDALRAAAAPASAAEPELKNSPPNFSATSSTKSVVSTANTIPHFSRDCTITAISSTGPNSPAPPRTDASAAISSPRG